jgi:hypothetical protein
MPPVFLPGEDGGGVRGLSPVRSRRPRLEGCARNWSNGGYMRLKGREVVTTVEAMRHMAEAAAVPL